MLRKFGITLKQLSRKFGKMITIELKTEIENSNKENYI
jgi:hypothetical protein